MKPPRKMKGRGSQLAPPNRFQPIQLDADWEQLEFDSEATDERTTIRTQYYPDASRSIVSQNDSPDVPFRYSLNPYRGCSHGCSYCYARPTHEYLGWNAGIDFETKVMVKRQAAALFRKWLGKRETAEPVILSGVTDCYQPAERSFRITRACLEVAQQSRQPISIVTKNALVTRDLDLLVQMASENLIHVAVSITSLDQQLTKRMEPRTSAPEARLRAIEQLNQAGVPTMVMVAPVIPGLTDSQLPGILQAACEAGAQSAGYILLRLPSTVRPVFMEWLDRVLPHGKSRVLGQIRATRDGDLNQSQFGERMRGSGVLADQIHQAFQVFSRKHQLDKPLPQLDCSRFCPPAAGPRQLPLF